MKHITEKYFDQVVDSVREIVKFDSSQKPAEGAYPFGKETADCLACFLSLAEKMGFETHNYDNYAGEVIFGEGEELAILAHLDVVPAGDGWKYPPFGALVNDDLSEGGVAGRKIWGRGTMDDKGPAVATLYSLKALKDEGFTPRRKIKLIVGCNEENGWACLDHYNKVAHMPEEGFSPDADFPAIYAEKGILHLAVSFPISDPLFSSFAAGSAANMVCDKAVIRLNKRGRVAMNGILSVSPPSPPVRAEWSDGGKTLTLRGKSAHGSTPEKGVNALGALLSLLSAADRDCAKIYDLLFADRLGLKKMRDETGFLTMSPDMAEYKDGALTVTVDIRFPATRRQEEITDALNKAGVSYEILHYQAPLYTAPDSEPVATLMRAYNKVTGRNEKPIAIGGGTYARALKRGCGFGPEFEDEEATIHQPNEYVTFDRIRLMCEIYYEAIKALTE